MTSEPAKPGPGIEEFRSYLLLLARLQVGAQTQARLDASDLVQQTLLEAHRKRDQFVGKTSGEMAGWLRRMLAFCIADAVRAQHRAKRDVAREKAIEGALAASSAQLANLLSDGEPSPSEQAVFREELTALATALLQLPEDQRQAVELKHLCGSSVTAIAQALGRTETAVGGLLRRGMAKLRDLLKDEPHPRD